jgi:uncharacterized membrane protein YqjE
MNWISLIEMFRAARPSTNEEITLTNSLDVIRLLRSTGGPLVAQLGLYGKLACAEWAREKDRLLKMLILILAGFACGLCMLIFIGALVLACSWETPYRLHVALVVIIVYGFGLAIAWYRFQALSSLSSQAFAATREEISADIALLKSRHCPT